MKLSAKEFEEQPFKRITLIGMSGAGKTHISAQLEKMGWQNYSCDYVIGAEYLKDEMGVTGEFTVENIGALSVYLGKLGSQEHGGFDLDTFKARQKAYYDAECAALRVMGQRIEDTKHFVHDSTGSLCEIVDDGLLRQIGEQTMFVYLKTDEETEADVLRRAQEYPKPLFFPPQFLEEHLALYMTLRSLTSVDEIVPDDFSRWVFPLLFEARKPKYQMLADMYGVSIPAKAFYNFSSSDDFISIISEHLS